MVPLLVRICIKDWELKFHHCSSYSKAILGAFAKLLRVITVSFVMSVCTSVRPSVCLSFHMEQLAFHCTDFYGIYYLSIFLKSVEEIKVSLISDQNNSFCTGNDNMSLNSYQIEKCFRLIYIVNQNTLFSLDNFFSEVHVFFGQCGKIW